MPSLQVMKRERESCIEDDNNGTTPIQTPQPNEKATPLIKLERDHSISTSMDDQLRDSNTTIIKREITPARSDTSSLSDLSSFTPKLEKHGSAFALLNGNVPPPAKRPKLTFAEKEAQIIMKEIKAREKAQEKAEQQAKREADASQRRFEKAQREFEREEERKRKDAELEERRAAKAAKDAEREKAKAAKEEEKRKKEEEKQKLEDEKKKKERAQPKLMSFFSTPKPKTQTEDAVSTLQKSNSMDTPSKNVSPIQPSDYEKMFPPFFVKEHVTLAPNNWFAKERWGSQNLEMELDNYISRASQQPYTIALDLPTLFNCPDLTLQARGRNIIPVRTIMEKVLGKAEKPIDLTTDSQNTQIRKTRRLLQSVPYKIISFSQDVRPSYTGTHTRHELAKLQKLARRPCKPELEDLHYDYDSEAEWVENDDDEGDAEDLHSIISEDEDEEDDGDPDGFIDDADAENIKRTALPADQEPQSTGLCWENHRRKGPNLKMYDYRMEVMNENINSTASIDPFSTVYWSTSSPKSGNMDPPRVPLRTMQNNTSTGNRPDIPSLFATKAAGDSTGSIGSASHSNGNSSLSSKSTGLSLALITDKDDIKIFRTVVENNTLTKIGLIEIIHQAMKQKSSTKKAVKASLEAWAIRHGGNKQGAMWAIREDVYPL